MIDTRAVETLDEQAEHHLVEHGLAVRALASFMFALGHQEQQLAEIEAREARFREAALAEVPLFDAGGKERANARREAEAAVALDGDPIYQELRVQTRVARAKAAETRVEMDVAALWERHWRLAVELDGAHFRSLAG